jgi:hypothetical protein
MKRDGEGVFDFPLDTTPSLYLTPPFICFNSYNPSLYVSPPSTCAQTVTVPWGEAINNGEKTVEYYDSYVQVRASMWVTA